MVIKKLIYILCFFILLALMLILASCADSSGADDSNSNNSEISDSAGDAPPAGADETETPDFNFIEELPEADFEGKIFTFLSYGDGTRFTWHAQDIIADEDSGDPMDEAVIARNRNVEERFGVKINAVFNGSYDSVSKSINSGDNSFDAVWLDMNSAGRAAQMGFFLDFNQLEYINAEKGYWDQSVRRDLSMGGRLYFNTGDISIVDKRATWIMMFNKEVLSRYALENPYELALKGDWTIDKFTEMAKGVSVNLNGTGVWDPSDQYGFVTTNDSIIGFFYSGGETIAAKNRDDMLEFAYAEGANLAKLHNISEKTVEIMKNNNITLNSNDLKDSEPWLIVRKAFEENRALFYAEVLAHVINMRAVENDFGIIPMPKYNKEQEHYLTYVNPAACFLGVPITAPDTNFVSIIIEATAAESSRILRPAYYDVLLKGKAVRDDESQEMLDLIFQNRSYDPGLIFNFGNFMSTYVNLLFKGDTNVASMIESQRARAESQIDAFNEKFYE